jgi:hypothetical protein
MGVLPGIEAAIADLEIGATKRGPKEPQRDHADLEIGATKCAFSCVDAAVVARAARLRMKTLFGPP